MLQSIVVKMRRLISWAFLTGTLVGQIVNGGFESPSSPGVPPVGWPAGSTVSTQGLGPPSIAMDAGMPSEGQRWMTLTAQGSAGALPAQVTGGFGAAPQGAVSVAQTFTLSGSQTRLNVAAVFMSDEPAASAYLDFLSVDLTDGTASYNMLRLDVNSPVIGTSAAFNRTLGGSMPITTMTMASLDIPAAFPQATTSTQFTLRLSMGNGVDGFLPSRGYFDAISLSAGTVVPAFTASPTVRIDPLPNGDWRLISEWSGHPGMEIYDVFSLSTGQPQGSGQFLGLWPDALTWGGLALPVGTQPFHVYLDAAGHYGFTIPAGVVTGLTVDVVMVVIGQSTVAGFSPVFRRTF